MNRNCLHKNKWIKVKHLADIYKRSLWAKEQACLPPGPPLEEGSNVHFTLDCGQKGTFWNRYQGLKFTLRLLAKYLVKILVKLGILQPLQSVTTRSQAGLWLSPYVPVRVHICRPAPLGDAHVETHTISLSLSLKHLQRKWGTHHTPTHRESLRTTVYQVGDNAIAQLFE